MNLYILYTGGTIGSVGNPLSPLTGPKFSEAFTAIVEPMIKTQLPNIDIKIDYFESTLDSTNMQPSAWVLMAQKIYDNFLDHDAFMVLHGTDTMAWTASALSFLLPGLCKPVTVTGSQLPIFYQPTPETDPKDYQLLYNTDALRNVLGGIDFMYFNIPEVGLYFADHLFRGNRTVKSNASEFIAFSSPNYSSLGEYGIMPTLNSKYVLPTPSSSALDHNYKKVGEDLKTIANNITNKSVIQFLFFPAYYSEPDGDESLLVSMLENLETVKPALKGIIFEAYGAGNIPDFQAMKDLVKKLHDKNELILVDCTQVFAGNVNYNAYATGAWLKEAGVIGGHDMTPICGLVKLIILLALNPEASQAKIEKLMGTNIAGEMTPYYYISGYQNDFLLPGETLYSINGNYQFINTQEGNLELYDTTDAQKPFLIWSQKIGDPGRLVMQSDNNLVYYNHDNKAIWATDTAEIGKNSYFMVDNDGTLALYNLDSHAKEYVIYEHKNEIEKRTISSPLDLRPRHRSR